MLSIRFLARRSRSRAMPARLVALPMLLALLTGCAGTTVVTVEALCDGAVEPVCIVKADRISDATASRIEANNRAIGSACKLTGNVCRRPTAPAAKTAVKLARAGA